MENEEKFRLTFHTSPDSINLNSFDDGTYLDINEGFTKIMGYSRDDVIGKSSITLNIWHNLEDRACLLSDLKKYGFVENLEAVFIRKDGLIRIGLMSARLLMIDDKEVIISITRDITDKKQTEKKLIESEKRYRQLIENITEEVWEIDKDDNYTYITPGSLDIYGLSPEEMIGKTPFDFMPAKESIRVREIFSKIKDGAKPFYNLENIIRHVNGREIYIEKTGVPFFDNDGNLLGYRGTDIDITEKRQNEINIQTLVESTVGLFGDQLFNIVTAKLCTWLKCDGAIVGKISNNNSVEVISMLLDGDLVNTNSYQIEGSPFEITVRDRYFVCPEKVSVLFPKNHALDEMGVSGYVGVALEGINSNVIGVLCCFSHGRISITKQTKNVMRIIAARLSSAIEREKNERARELLENQLQQAQKMESIGTLAGGIAHDFNNILSPIMGHTELLLYDTPEGSQLRYSLNEIQSASMRAKDLVRQILTFSRQEKSECKTMRMQYIIKEALKLIRSSIPAIIEIKHNIRKECGLINADPTQIHQIVMNLATNAYHAMEDAGGTMTIDLKEVELDAQKALNLDIKQGTYACLTVSDTGTGIPEDVKGKIFDPFFTTKGQGKGTGIGLSVVHGIVNSSGGAICVHSELGKGTEFNIYLPVVESYLKKNDALKVKMIIQGGTERVLLVDDEAPLITLQKQMLERLGYQVTSRTSSMEGLEAFRSSPDKFDLVITDMAMPNMSGDKLAVELIKIRPDIPVLLCTGFSTIISEEKALVMGIKGFLMKPVTISDLDKKIRDVLDKK